MVTIIKFVRTGAYSWELSYSSDKEDPTFYIYLDGVLIAETQQTSYTIALNLDESSVVEVLDDSDIQPMQVFPGKTRLGWFFVEGTDYYRVDEKIDEVWTERKKMPENNGYLQWQSRFLEDGQIHHFRVVPIGVNGNEGTAKEFAVLMVRRPDVPGVNYAYEQVSKQVVIYETDEPPDMCFATTTGTPNIEGNYFYTGIYNNEKYYRIEGGSYFIWSDGDNWIISSALGNKEGPYYARPSVSPMEGIYAAHNGATGTATVTLGSYL